jgi:hypothetical protein
MEHDMPLYIIAAGILVLCGLISAAIFLVPAALGSMEKNMQKSLDRTHALVEQVLADLYDRRKKQQGMDGGAE